MASGMILERRSSHISVYHAYPGEGKKQDDVLVIKRRPPLSPSDDVIQSVDCAVSKGTSSTEPILEHCQIYGILGIFSLTKEACVVAITDFDIVSSGIGEMSIYRVTEVKSFLVPGAAAKGPPVPSSRDKLYLRMIDDVVATKSLFFAENYDITHTLQRQAALELVGKGKLGASASPPSAACNLNSTKAKDLDDDAKSAANPVLPLDLERTSVFGGKDRALTWNRCDVRFAWNRHLVQPLLAAAAQEFAVCVVNGFIEHKQNVPVVLEGGKRLSLDLLLFSRRSCRRQGTRFNVRGIEDSGDVANFVETEQIVMQDNGTVSSFVQLRGSVPIVWSQPPTMKYTPKIHVGATDAQNHSLFRKHFAEQFQNYGNLIGINLIDQKGDQLTLGRQYRKHADQLSDNRLSVVWFDFHKECAKMRWHNLAKLVSQVQSDVDSMDQFIAHIQKDTGMFSVTNWQSGVLRTNCVDNLDRTNVVQSLFARRAVTASISGAHVPDAKKGEDVMCSPYINFESIFKNLWGDNADALSFLYSGTGALKTDFTRTGKRSIQGALADGWNSVKRYVLNNMSDGRTQDAWDYFLGRFSPAVENGVPPANRSAAEASSKSEPYSPKSTRLTQIRLPPLEAEKRYKRELTPQRFLNGSILVFTILGTLLSSVTSSMLMHSTGDDGYPGFLSYSISLLWANPLTNSLLGSNPPPASYQSQWVREAFVGFTTAAVMFSGVAIWLARTGKPGLVSRLLVSRPHFIQHDLVKSQRGTAPSDKAERVPVNTTKGNVE
eukprot:gb/GECG01004623.1/.p1 GENE.gb/GECG01004623.1/~~gb/GECG01004623.1/.p1  ORF type:complete len:775 (+),score=78.23 gb/GECG01004623.1/:1-2325(+)